MTEIIKILIAEDHAVVREGLRAFISILPDMVVVGEAENGEQAIALARTLGPDVILMDLVMPKKNGIEAILEIKRENPAIRILVITSFVREDLVLPAIQAGALGYILKDTPPQGLIQAIRDVYNGISTVSPLAMNQIMSELNGPSDSSSHKTPLTAREVEVVEQVANGLSNQEIALNLQISEWTVRTHISKILSRLQLSNRTQITLYALREGIVKLERPRT
jgi:two-component system, NarL family, response regulator LiaR